MNDLLAGMREFLSINNVLFVFWGYPMSYVEFIGTTLNIWCVYLASRAKLLNWPVGIAASVLYLALFYQIRLYSDMGEQLYFILTGFYGWWMWGRLGGRREKEVAISRSTARANAAYAFLILAGSLFLMRFMLNLNLYLPEYFPEPASYPFWDAFTTVLSFVATILMARGKLECWYLWVLVDVIGVWLYFAKGVKFISFEYVIFLVLATWGLLDWKKKYQRKTANI